jgi:hypothetical protein
MTVAISETNKLLAKKHLKLKPTDTGLDTYFTALEATVTMETQFTTAVTLCETLFAQVQTVRTEADELTSGGGATFDYWQAKRIKEEGYQNAVNDLCRQLEQPELYETGAGAITTGWNRL